MLDQVVLEDLEDPVDLEVQEDLEDLVDLAHSMMVHLEATWAVETLEDPCSTMVLEDQGVVWVLAAGKEMMTMVQ